MDIIIAFIVGAAFGAGVAAVAFLIVRRSAAANDPAAQLAAVQQQLAAASQQLSEAQQRASAGESVANELRTQLAKASADFGSLRQSMDTERSARVEAQTRLQEAAAGFEQQRGLLDQARAQMLDAFKALSGDALKSNNQSFLELARKAFDATLAEARGDVGKRQAAIDGLIKPLQEQLVRYEQQVKALENARTGAYAGLQEQLKGMAATQQQLQKEAASLVTALRAPQVRGRWGEVTLHRVVELAGMSDHCDYAEQVSVDVAATDENSAKVRNRPDMIVHLPGGRDVVVDSKVSLEAYLRAVQTTGEEERAACLTQHARQLRSHMDDLAGKSYWLQFDKAPEFVVMFIPGESFFAAALDCDHQLLEDGMGRRVVMATPTTLIALLRAVAYGWRQEQLAANAEAISQLGRELYERLKVLSVHVLNTGRHLKQATEQYNKMVGSMETRVMPSVRKFQELGVGAGEPVPEIEPVELQPRQLTIEVDSPKQPTAEA